MPSRTAARRQAARLQQRALPQSRSKLCWPSVLPPAKVVRFARIISYRPSPRFPSDAYALRAQRRMARRGWRFSACSSIKEEYMATAFLAEAQELSEELVSIRRDLHMHPELG